MGNIVGEIIKVAYTPLNLLQLESQNLNMKMHLTKLEEENRQMKVKDFSESVSDCKFFVEFIVFLIFQ